MEYDFDQIWDRRGTGSIKWDQCPKSECESLLPMGIADMDFSTPDFVLDGIQERLEHPMFGYFFLDQRFYDSIKKWHKERFFAEGIFQEHIQYQHSVLGSIAAAIAVTTSPGDPVLVQTPGYPKFKEITEQNHRKLIENPLVKAGESYVLDYEDMEEKIRRYGIKTAIFCSPSNPVGRVWKKEELTRYIELCRKYDVTIVADEIWADFAYGRNHTPLHTMAGDYRERIISLYSPTKTFNLAGLVISYAVIFNKELAERFQNHGEMTHYNNCNALAAEALIAAYDKGGQWVDRLNDYIKENVEYVRDFIHRELPKVQVNNPEGTYLLWLNFEKTGLSAGEIPDRCLNRAGLLLNDGRTCISNGDFCMRMNAATQRTHIKEAMERLKRAF